MLTWILTLPSFTVLALISAFLGAVATLLARTLLKDLRSKEIIGINFLTMAAILLLLSPWFYHFSISPTSFFILVLIALLDTLANYFYFKTFEQTEASTASPLLSLAPGFTFLFGWFLLSDAVSLRTYLTAALIVICIIIFSTERQQWKTFNSKTLFPALASSLLFGLSAIPSKFLLSTLQATNAPTLYMFRASFIALFALLFFHFTIRSVSIRQYRLLFSRSLIVIAQWLLFYTALSGGAAGVTVTLANLTPIFVFFLGVVFLKERPTLKKSERPCLFLALR